MTRISLGHRGNFKGEKSAKEKLEHFSQDDDNTNEWLRRYNNIGKKSKRSRAPVTLPRISIQQNEEE